MNRSVAILLGLLLAGGCASDEGVPPGPALEHARQEVRLRWGRELEELPIRRLEVISAHSEDIQREYEWAFNLHHAVEHGQRVRIEWRSVGGGSSSIEQYLLRVYERSDSSGLDVVWGGGDFSFMTLARAGILETLDLPQETLAAIPEVFGGVRMMDAQQRWIGSAVSGFGFLYNAELLEWCNVPAPQLWEDLGEPVYADRLLLADPTQSGSAAAAYRMIAISADTWPQGWANLLGVLSNAKRFVDSAGAAANAPLIGEGLVSTSIDFYGALRVAEGRGKLVYVSPRGQTTFSPDPIGIVRNPQDAELAGRFVQFVLSAPGQALWALPPGAEGGPIRRPLGRQPIRRDVYETHEGRFLPWIVDPYQAGQALDVEGPMNAVDFGVLRRLVGAAAIDNRQGLRDARNALIAAGWPDDLVREFVRLPDNIVALEDMQAISVQLRDEAQRLRILTDWQRFFREKYAGIVAEARSRQVAGGEARP